MSCKIKKVISTILVLALLIGVNPFGTFEIKTEAASYSKGYYYTVKKKKATITRYVGSATEVTIPSTLGGYPVIAIGKDAFEDNYSIKEVTIGNNVKTIGYAAFENCRNLVTVKITGNVETIDQYAFSYCDDLETISIPKSIKTIGCDAFYESDWIEKVYITDIAAWCNIDFGCSQSNPLYSGELYFNKKLVKDLVIPEGVTQIKDWVFYSTDIETVIISNTVKSIGSSAFSNCYNIKEVTLPNSVTSIGGHAFSGCSSLESIVLGDGVKTIEKWAFGWDESLKNITVSENNETFSSVDGVLFNKDKTKLIKHPQGKYYENSTYDIPIGVITIGENAFEDCYIDNIIIPDSTITIEENAFLNCSILELTIPDSVQTIGAYAFAVCENLYNAIIGNGVTIIGEAAFNGCGYLENVKIGNSVKEIREGAFAGCEYLTSIVIPDNVNRLGERAFYECSGLEDVVIGNGITTIEEYAFDGCKYLSNLTIGNSVENIGICAFAGCSYFLDDLEIPNGVKYIGSGAFSGCYNIRSLTIGNNVENIEWDAFYGCDNLETVNFNAINCEDMFGYDGWRYSSAFSNTSLISLNIGNDVKTIPQYAFADCYYLENVTIGENVETIAKNAFAYCTNIASIEIPDSVKSIEKNAFADCYYLKNLTIGNGVTTIGEFAFGLCVALEDLTIGNSVTTIEETAFCWCDNLKSVTLSNSVKTIGIGAFNGAANLENVYFIGNEADRNTIEIGDENGYFQTTTWHYNTDNCTSDEHIFEIITTNPSNKKDGRIESKCTICGQVENCQLIGRADKIKLYSESCTYNGKSQKPMVEVYDAYGNVISSKNYTVSYASGRKYVGKYKVTVKLKGNYSGSLSTYFTINPKGTSVSKLTAGKKSLKVSIKKQSSQTSGYQIQYSTSKKFTSAKTKTLSSNKKTSYTLKSLKAKKTYYVRVRTYKTVSGKKYYSSWSSYKSKKTK